MEKVKIDSKDVFLLFNTIFAISALLLLVVFVHTVGKLVEQERPEITAIKGKYINKTVLNTDLKLFFSDSRFTIREENNSDFEKEVIKSYRLKSNKILGYGSYEKLQEGVYSCKGPSTSGFAILNGNKVALYISGFEGIVFRIDVAVFERYGDFTSEIDEEGKELDRERSDSRWTLLIIVIALCYVLIRDFTWPKNNKKKNDKCSVTFNKFTNFLNKKGIDTKSTAVRLNLILVAVIICLTVGYNLASAKLIPEVRVLKGSYYTGTTYGEGYTMAFTDDRFILQDQNKTVQRGTYKCKQVGFYSWEGEHVDGYVFMKNSGIAVYFKGADKLVVMQQYDSIPVTFSTYDDGAYWLNQESSYAPMQQLNYTNNLENGLPPLPKEHFPTQDEVQIPVYKLFYQYMNTLMLQEKHDFSGVAADTDEMFLIQNYIRYELEKLQKKGLKWAYHYLELEELSRLEQENSCVLTILCTVSSWLTVNDVSISDSSETSYDVALVKQDGVWLVSSIIDSGPGQSHPIAYFKQQIAEGSDPTKSYRENIVAVTDELIV